MADVVDSDNRVRAYPGDLSYNKRMLREQQGELAEDVLSAVLSLVNIGVEIYIGNVAIEDGPSRLYHAIRELRADTDGMSEMKNNVSGRASLYYSRAGRTQSLVFASLVQGRRS